MFVACTDGAARGRNGEGPASSAFVIFDEKGKLYAEEYAQIGIATNNVAEYTALIRLLTFFVNAGLDGIEIRSDSELMVKQINGQYAVKNPKMLGFWSEAMELLSEIKQWSLTWVPRSENSYADALCNKALDNI